jgi:phosphoribosylamine--glycine ligase/phosphoribosylglycinamide formyltransferase/phosphoribosylformylglycinamidine cyclo-ligase
VDFVVVGPEQPLADGLVDALLAASIPCFGPTQAAAQLEASKAFSKAFMQQHSIPTARFQTFSNKDAALAYITEADFPALVVKASGLAAGKGVIVAASKQEACQAVVDMFEGKFGAAGSEVVVEELLHGPEVSCLAFCDGQTAIMMPPAQDHKRQLDFDQGPNTGGKHLLVTMAHVLMALARDGGLCAMPIDQRCSVDRHPRQHCHGRFWKVCLLRCPTDFACMQPTLQGMQEAGHPYHGTLYVGLMLTNAGPKVLEYNCRFGDPETQASATAVVHIDDK